MYSSYVNRAQIVVNPVNDQAWIKHHMNDCFSHSGKDRLQKITSRYNYPSIVDYIL